MREICYMTKRNCLVYVRDRAAVFFSLLSTMIVLALMVIFLGEMNSENLVLLLEKYGGERNALEDEKNAAYLVQLWTLGGILVVNSVTVTLTVLGTMVQDEARKRIMAFYVTPVKRIKLALGYIFAAWIVGAVMCLLTLAAGEGFFLLKGYGLLSAECHWKLFGMIALNVFTFSSLGYLMALAVHSESAWSGLLTVVGTLVGFAGGIYLPMSALSKPVQTVLKCLPVLHGASMLQGVCTEAAVEKTFQGLPDMAGDVFREKMGITLWAGEHEIILQEKVLFLLAYAIIAIVISAFLSKRRRLKDR